MPEPPAELTDLQLTIVEFNQSMFRTHSIHRGPLSSSNQGLNRFDAPDGSYDVLYAGCDPHCAFIETFAHADARTVTTAELKRKVLSEIKASKPLRLVNLCDSGVLLHLGADSRLFAGGYEISQLWSRAFHNHPMKVQGLIYPSRLDPTRRAIGLYMDRVGRIIELDRKRWYEPGPQRILLTEITQHYNIALIENQFVVSRKPVTAARQTTIDETP
jgi:RES domain